MNKGSDADLLPCPFCGSDNLSLIGHDYVHCHTCEADGPYNYTAIRDDAAAKWNARALTKVEDTE